MATLKRASIWYFRRQQKKRWKLQAFQDGFQQGSSEKAKEKLEQFYFGYAYGLFQFAKNIQNHPSKLVFLEVTTSPFAIELMKQSIAEIHSLKESRIQLLSKLEKAYQIISRLSKDGVFQVCSKNFNVAIKSVEPDVRKRKRKISSYWKESKASKLSYNDVPHPN
eukprot:TRINITY_DN2103_c0_g1_i1.p1 TRINITY_DN2103_c0_g1~~TRINITY_DN2103_c0_g1_i1.p1  ORF type:complete len:165 (+),score=30.53 TRINITY_DN2103_c0_g1_i1:144-638(+)